MDFLDRVSDYIEERIKLETPLRVGRLEKEPSSIAIRPTPSNVISRFMDRGKTYEYSFQIMMKDPDQLKVNNQLNEITNLLDGLSNSEIISGDGSFIFVKCEVYVFPNYVEMTEHGEYIYTALFTAELEGGQ